MKIRIVKVHIKK